MLLQNGFGKASDAWRRFALRQPCNPSAKSNGPGDSECAVGSRLHRVKLRKLACFRFPMVRTGQKHFGAEFRCPLALGGWDHATSITRGCITVLNSREGRPS